jgi:predicted nucleic acid-binding protein
MVKAFIDTNVLMDLFLKDRPEKPLAEKIFSGAQEGRYQAFITTQSIIDTAYSSRKNGIKLDEFKTLLNTVRSFIKILAIDELDLLWAIGNPTGDFEDDAQYGSAYNGVCDFFITRDNALRKLNSPFCPMTVMSPSEFVEEMERD